jgi:hypothetical protein
LVHPSQTEDMNIIMLVAALFTIFFLFMIARYIQWRFQVFAYQKSLGLPIAFSYYVHPALPFGEYFGKPTSEEQERLILETSKNSGSPFVICVNGGFFTVTCW